MIDGSDSQNPWYASDGPENDVVISTRVRLARNLANFPFTKHFRADDGERVQTLVFDAFSHAENAEEFHALPVSALDKSGVTVLMERGVFGTATGTGVVLKSDGKISCTVNDGDHVRIASFAAGLDCNSAFADCRDFDALMQEKLQFAASYDFGYLTQALCDAGSGMKISLRVHVPASVHIGNVEKLFEDAKKQGFIISSPFGVGGRTEKSLGSFYQVSTAAAELGSEIDQLAAIYSVGKGIVETERKIRAEYAENKQTESRNIILRAYALAKFSMLLSWRESVDIISDLKWGIDFGLIGGVSDSELYSLLFRIQDGHLAYLMNSGQFNFESDISNSHELKIMRLRAVSIQETVSKMNFK